MILYACKDDQLKIIFVSKNRVEQRIFDSYFYLYHTEENAVIGLVETGYAYLIKPEGQCTINDILFTLIPNDEGYTHFKTYTYQDEIIIGTVMNDISISTSLLNRNTIIIDSKQHTIQVHDSTHAYLNKQRIHAHTVYQIGDVLDTYYLHILFEKDFVYINKMNNVHISLNLFDVHTQLLKLKQNIQPQTIYQPELITSYTINIEEPDHITTYEKRSIIFSMGPAITMSLASMLGASISIYRGYMMGREVLDMLPMILLPAMMLLSTIFWQPLQHLHDKTQSRNRTIERSNNYLKYLNEKTLEIIDIYHTYIHTTNQIIVRQHHYLQQRNIHHLYIPMGYATSALQFAYHQSFHFTKEDQNLKNKLDTIQYKASHLFVPYVLQLDIGDHVVLENLEDFMYLIMQYIASVYHENDVLIAILVNQHTSSIKRWMKRIPHLYHHARRLISSSLKEIDTLSQEFQGIKVLLNLSNQATCELKDWICIDSHTTYNPTHLIYRQDNMLMVQDHQKKQVYRCIHPFDTMQINRSHMAFPQLQSHQYQTYSFLSMYGIDDISELHIQKRWEQSDIAKSLAIVLGKDMNDHPIYFDLHESKDGPHGLIAGMTGSGKSELITSLLLSLAIHFKPEDLQIVLFDFKGGGVSSVLCLKDTYLPHVCASLSNLDIEDMRRSLHALRNICIFREKIFKQLSNEIGYPIINLHAYRNEVKQCKGYPNIAELIILVDEFAELKHERPEFLDELIAIARVGRSLGLHLILATQKPAGVVNDQIWANTNFRICMKVAEKQDSMEILHDGCASTLQRPGEFYLYTAGGLQHGISGYAHAKKESSRYIRILDMHGNIEASSNFKQKSTSQLIQVLKHIKQLHPTSVDKLWLDPLKPKVLMNDEDFSIGYIDDYYQFQQPKFILDFNQYQSYLFVGKDYQDRKQIIDILQYRIQEKTSSVCIIDDIFCQKNDSDSILKSDDVHQIQERFQDIQDNYMHYILITDITLFLQHMRNQEILQNLLESLQKYHVGIFIIAQSVVNIPYRILSFIQYKVSLRNESYQEIQTLFSTSEKGIQKKSGYGFIMDHQHLLECCFLRVHHESE